jgi:2-(1,2-epoxy-1,2-dihydrophenyl)acetyl-CoA isomerase
VGKWGIGYVGELVILERVGPVGVLTLNRAERHNSLVPELLEAMLAALEGVGAQDGVRAVVLQANGRSFSTGGDVRGFYEHLDDLEAYAGEIVGRLNGVILAMIALPVPIVAAVQGIVTGGSMGLVLGSDIVLVTPEASFTPYYSVVGFSPDGGWTALLPAIIGLKRTGEVLMRNQTITAEQAVAWGLASRIVPADRIREEALSMAQDLAAMKAGSIGHTKATLGPACSDLESGLEAERSRFVQQIMTEEARQGIEAFLGQRQVPARDDRKVQ